MADTTTATAAPGSSARETHKGYEMPPYRVELTDGAFEVRDYDPYLIAEVTVPGDRSGAIGRGFRMLAGYIFGGNADKEKVSMTVPVAQSPADATPDAASDGDWTVSFMMPASYTLSTLPKPGDSRIRLTEHPAERVAVVRFSGIPGDRSLQAKSDELKAWAEARGLKITAGPHYWFYDAPMTLPWNRRNEVAFTIR